jgi:hypothetical protein
VSEGTGIAPHSARAMRAAERLAHRLELDGRGMHILHSSNNTIVHLPASALVAKVGTSANAAETFAREVAIATHLKERGADIAPPASSVPPGPHHEDGLAITLWHYLPHDPEPDLDDDELARSLARLHDHLVSWPGELPDYRDRIRDTGRLLADEDAMHALTPEGLELLRTRFEAVAPTVLERAHSSAVLHGAPHLHNVLATPDGLRWIDFETCCRGPLEADLAYLGEAGNRRANIDLELLAQARQMLRVMVATTCWRDPDRHPRLREAAEYHLAALADE